MDIAINNRPVSLRHYGSVALIGALMSMACRARLSRLSLPLSLAVAGFIIGCNKGDDSKSGSQSSVDPWEKKLADLRDQYTRNQELLRSDWQVAMREAQNGDLDANALARDIVSLNQKVVEQAKTLDDWNRQLLNEIALRGLKPEAQ